MKWRRGRMSRNIEDRRGRSGGGMFGGGGFGGGYSGGGMGMPVGRLSLPVVVLLVVGFILVRSCAGDGGGGSTGGIDDILGGLPAADPGTGAPPSAEDQRLAEFMSYVLDDAQGFWDDTFREAGKDYPEAKLVLFSGRTNSACGGATSAIGPHYCPVDQKMYLDLDFFRELRDRFGASGDFAQAYVLAHEVAHHVQNVLGIMDRTGRSNEESVRLELQADCFAGVWAFTVYERGDLEEGDLEEGLTAAAAVGDDRIQEQAGQNVNPETWTHGSSEQRMRWFRAGFADGDPNACDTFNADI